MIVVGIVIVAVGLMLRSRPGRAATAEEHLEQAALRAEQDRNKTEQMYRADRFNLRD